jgi:hypothetical protein
MSTERRRAADVAGNYGVAALLETRLADQLALAERIQQWLRRIAETDIAEKIGANRAAQSPTASTQTVGNSLSGRSSEPCAGFRVRTLRPARG